MLILKPPFLTAWKDKDPFEEIHRIGGDVCRAVQTRETRRFDFCGEIFYIKEHDGMPLRQFIKDLVHMRRPVLGAKQEWDAIAHLHKHGVATMEAVAFGQQEGGNPLQQPSFLITRDLNPTIDMHTYLAGWKANPPSRNLRTLILQRMAQTIRNMHQSGLNHKDCYVGHFLLKLPFDGSEENLTISVIDLHRAEIRERVPLHFRNKDLYALYYSVRDLNLSRTDYWRFLKTYFDSDVHTIWNTEKKTILAAEKHLQRILRHSQKHGYI